MPRVGRPKTPQRSPGQRGRLPGQKIKKKKLCLKRGIYRTSKNMYEIMSLTKSGMEVMNSITVDMFKKICKEAGIICEMNNKQVFNARAVLAATKMVLPEEMAEQAVEQAQAACLKHHQYEEKYSQGGYLSH